MIRAFIKLFLENSGAPSMMRFQSFMIVAIIMVTWVYTCVTTDTFVNFTYEQASVLAVAVGGKALQKKLEK